MSNYGLPKYDKYRKWMREARENSNEWEDINYALRDNEEGLEEFLEIQRNTNWWKINSVEWHELVKLERKAEEETKPLDDSGQAIIMDERQDNATRVPENEYSSWQLYRNRLLEQGFKRYTVDEMEKTTIKLLRRLSKDTTEIPPIKGLVIGNVQSGKTANMAALMAMAADWGWNMFIVLSGTIENLRQQTQNRLLNDLNHPGNLIWMGLEHLSKKPSYGMRTQDLHFEEESKQRYFTVCLKNASRLKGLIQWLQSDKNKQKQMKILVIDDEADQAGINTIDISKNERRTINRLICNMVNSKNERGEEIEVKYKAMNYIGYTATPYANVLNEAKEESLYPRNFISTLNVSKEYFGPQQIFGVDGGDYDGMNIVRIIDENDLNEVKNIHDNISKDIPISLRNAICWFLCGASCMRVWGYKKPISMLIHTSQKTDYHTSIAIAVKEWIEGNDKEFILKCCEDIWNIETNKFTFENFREQYKNYDCTDEEINRYPQFNEIKKQIKILISCITNIKLGEDYEFEYHDGIHLCIDNCKNNGVKDDGMYVRLAYPESKKMPEPAPVFIVIGGATLSRGLTIEGLISTFFLRSVNQADTLMQMGRWFGYRKGYELLPRIWITEKTNEQFKFLSSLDEELREEIYYMDTMRLSPANYGPRIKNTPKYSFIRITNKNRMQSAKLTDMDFSGSFNQTYLFDNDFNVLKSNINVVTDFIEKLGNPEEKKACNKHAENYIIWRNVKFKFIESLLKKYKFQERLKVFNDIDGVIDWIKKTTEKGEFKNWNVIIPKKEKSKNGIWKLSCGDVNKVTRTRKLSSENDSVIDIGVLRDPKDILADIDLDIVIDKNKNEVKNNIKNFKAKKVKTTRSLAGLDNIPQLIIYMIDKNSKSTSSSRIDLNAKEDIVGICINIPGGKRGKDYATTVSIHLENDIFNDNGDLEDTNGY